MMKTRFTELDLIDLGDEIWDELVPRATAALDAAVGVVITETKRNLSRDAERTGDSISFEMRGRVFSRKGRRTVAFAGSRVSPSDPGTPPRKRSGELMDSMRPGKLKKSKYSLRREYGSDHPAAGLHEFGGSVTQDGKRRIYPPRPYLRPAEEATSAEVGRILDAL